MHSISPFLKGFGQFVKIVFGVISSALTPHEIFGPSETHLDLFMPKFVKMQQKCISPIHALQFPSLKSFGQFVKIGFVVTLSILTSHELFKPFVTNLLQA